MLKYAPKVMCARAANEVLTAPMQTKLFQEVVDFVVKHYGLHPSAFDMQLIARATIKMFPYLKKKNSQSDGTVSFFQVMYKFPC